MKIIIQNNKLIQERFENFQKRRKLIMPKVTTDFYQELINSGEIKISANCDNYIWFEIRQLIKIEAINVEE